MAEKPAPLVALETYIAEQDARIVALEEQRVAERNWRRELEQRTLDLQGAHIRLTAHARLLEEVLWYSLIRQNGQLDISDNVRTVPAHERGLLVGRDAPSGQLRLRAWRQIG